jgi:threonine dehydrogenase-like Zn-dependent dehydrogenase
MDRGRVQSQRRMRSVTYHRVKAGAKADARARVRSVTYHCLEAAGAEADSQKYFKPHSIIQVLLRIDTVGICGSDVKYWTVGSIGHITLCLFG